MSAARRLLLACAFLGSVGGLAAVLFAARAGACPQRAEIAAAASPSDVTGDAGVRDRATTDDARATDAGIRDATAELEARMLLMLSDAAPRPEPIATNGTGEARAAAAANLFALDLFPRLPPRSNAAFSPASVAIALAMARSGAHGATEHEIARALHLEAMHDPDAAFGELSAYLRGLDDREGVALNIANRLWGIEVTPDQDYADRLVSLFEAPMSPGSVHAINAWANAETRGRVPWIVSSLPLNTGMVITNAVYFNGKWQHAFKKTLTTNAPFRTHAGIVSVPMMKQEAMLAYAHVGGVQAVDLPYRGGFSMLVLLPDVADGLRAFVTDLTPNFQTLRAALRYGTIVDLSVPRWTTRWKDDLVSPLQATGIHLAFTRRADFSGINARVPMWIAEVLHESFVDVNEEGTEAAAVTAIPSVFESFGEEPPRAVFHANHPFVYVIHEAATDAILFMGRVDDPSL